MSALQTSVSRSNIPAFAGQLANAGDPATRRESVINSVPQRRQVGTITVDTATDGATYTWAINGVVLTLVAATSETTTTIAAKIAAVINAEPAVRGQVVASSAVAVVTLTAVSPGIGFTASDSDAKITTVQASTTPLEADGLPFGRWAAILGEESSEIDPGIKSAAVAASAYLTAQVASYTYTTYEAGVVLAASVKFDGQTYTASHVSATDANTSAAALRANLEEALDGLPLAVSGSDADVIITATAGAEFEAVIHFASAASSGVLTENANLGPRPGTSLSFGGIVQRHLTTEGIAMDGNQGGVLVTGGKVFVELEGGGNPAVGAPVYVYVGATAADRGKIYAAAGTDRLQLPRSVARFDKVVSGRGGQVLARLSLSAR